MHHGTSRVVCDGNEPVVNLVCDGVTGSFPIRLERNSWWITWRTSCHPRRSRYSTRCWLSCRVARSSPPVRMRSLSGVPRWSMAAEYASRCRVCHFIMHNQSSCVISSRASNNVSLLFLLLGAQITVLPLQFGRDTDAEESNRWSVMMIKILQCPYRPTV